MTTLHEFYQGQRLSYDGALCTVTTKPISVNGTNGHWIGVEWDDATRGKHNGTYNGRQYFQCRHSSPTAASFVRPSRRADPQRTVLQAIRFKYEGGDAQALHDPIIISGKVAEEIGFEKIAMEQADLENLRVVLLDQLLVNGVAPRTSSSSQLKQYQAELQRTCPGIVELDISCNPIETLEDVEHICVCFSKLQVLNLR